MTSVQKKRTFERVLNDLAVSHWKGKGSEAILLRPSKWFTAGVEFVPRHFPTKTSTTAAGGIEKLINHRSCLAARVLLLNTTVVNRWSTLARAAADTLSRLFR